VACRQGGKLQAIFENNRILRFFHDRDVTIAPGPSGQDVGGGGRPGNHLLPHAFRAWDWDVSMVSGIEYRRNAEMRLLLAEDPDSRTKSILMMMAAAWHRLAQDREGTERLVEDVEATAHRGSP
jgi:hypothetical protein